MPTKLTKSFKLYNSLSILACIVFVFLRVCPSMAALPRGNETDRLALIAFRDSITEDPFDIFSSWNRSVHYCTWAGVYCSKRHPGRVTVLNLQDKKLRGKISPHLGNLSFLREIHLSENGIQGIIPQELGILARLRHLNLSYNTLEGKIASNLSHCANLQAIDLASNNLAGEIPQEFSYLVTKKLKALYVYTNYLTGSIPPWLGNSSSLLQLSMAGNYIQGSIPIELGRLSNLRSLLIRQNKLSGVPLPIYNLSTLLQLDMGDNHLFGRIPQDIGLALPKLQYLFMGGNHFTGLVPVSLANSSRLEKIDFGANEFSGTLPLNLGCLKALSIFTVTHNLLETTETEGFSFLTSLTNCSNLQALDIGYNRLKGELPTSIANFSNALQFFILPSNNISGAIPRDIENLIGLGLLAIYENSITGKIPAGIGKLQSLEDLRLYSNKISGQIPASLGNITRLRQLSLDSNDLGGSLPRALGNCSKLELLDLSNNKFTGIIPRELASLSSFTIGLILAQNSLTGPLPIEFGNMDKLLDLDVSQNRLSGEIPSTISKCLMLEELYLRENIFDGNIPLALSTLKSLQSLDFSRNNLSGPIPKYLQNFTLLQYLNLSFNTLEGEVPQEGIFRNQSAFAVHGNKNLCGGIKSLGLPACDIPILQKRKTYHTIKIVIPVAISCLIVLACLIGCFYWKKRSGGNPLTMLLVGEKFRKVSYVELLRATNGFSPSNLLGEGHHGSVYKGILGNDRMIVAVKVFNLAQRGAAKSFVSECNALRNIRHRNLLKIITMCSSIDFKCDEFKALVFEFMPNGSLEEWLHQINNFEGGYNRSLNLSQRLSIAIDVASALEYLHHHCHVAIAHGDLKPSNILIDHDLTARVGDFGLARFLSDSLPTHSQNQTSSTAIKGTVGYVAPEYGLGSRASFQGDVYSFGILLLEMFTGKRPTDNLFDESLNLHQFTKIALPNRVMEIVEPSVSMEGDAGNGLGTNRTKELLVEVLRVGVRCSAESPAERMDIRDAVAEMHRIKNRFFSIRT